MSFARWKGRRKRSLAVRAHQVKENNLIRFSFFSS